MENEKLETAQSEEPTSWLDNLPPEAAKEIKSLRKEAETYRKSKNDIETRYKELEAWKMQVEQEKKSHAENEMAKKGEYEQLLSQYKTEKELMAKELEQYKKTVAEVEDRRKQEYEAELQKVDDEELRESFSLLGLAGYDAVKKYNAKKSNTNSFASPGLEAMNFSQGVNNDVGDYTLDQLTKAYMTDKSLWKKMIQNK